MAYQRKEEGGRTKKPIVFTELGIAMLSSALKSARAVKVNISIMRTFVKLRSYIALEDRVDRKVNSLEQDVTKVFKVVFEKLDRLEKSDIPAKSRRKIGFENN